MAIPLYAFLLLLSLFVATSSAIHVSTLRRPTLVSDSPPSSPPTTFFEVTKPIKLPKTKPYSKVVLEHDFASTYGKPPVISDYTPPPAGKYDKVVLEWTATSKGRQFDRIFGVWLGGVEILRSWTAEPRPNGIIWTVKKDISSPSKEELLQETMKCCTTRKQQPQQPLTDVERKLKCEYEKIKLVRGVRREASGGLMKARLRPTVEEWAKEAVNYYNKEVKYEKMRLRHVKEALYQSLPLLAYHINFDVNLIEEDGKETPWACQAVVFKERKNGPVEVFSLKLGCTYSIII